jgi:uncharacterized Fe-S cluster-containing radical SAM superfamily enzyme
LNNIHQIQYEIYLSKLMKKLYDTPIKAIRKKCLDCTAGSRKEIRLCPVVECALYPYRFGRRPSQAIVETIKKYYEQKVEPAKGLLPKKGTIK